MALPVQVFHTAKASTNVSNVTTDDVDSTGSTLIVGSVSFASGQACPITDSLGNTVTLLTQRNGAGGAQRTFYILNPITGPGHNWFVNTVVASIEVQGWSGGFDGSSFQTATGIGSPNTLPNSPGSITPTDNDALFILGIGSTNSGQTFSLDDPNFTIDDQFPGSGTAVPGAIASYPQAVAAAANPQVTSSTGPQEANLTLAVFLQTAPTVVVIELTGIASSFAAGTPTMVSAGTVVPDGIPSSFAAGTPTLHATVTIGLTGIPSSFAAGVPTLIEGGGGGGGHASAWYWSGPAARMLADAGFLLLVLPELERQELEEAAAK